MKKIFNKILLTLLICTFLPNTLFALSRSDLQKKVDQLDDNVVETFAIPVAFDVTVSELTDTWGEARAAGRSHEGVDIMVPRGSFVASPTSAVVHRIETTSRGGLVVWTINPGGERFYYAHLDSVYEDLQVGDELKTGDLIGFVGNSGNASGGATHLHFGVYDENWNASNPFSRLKREFTEEERIELLKSYLRFLVHKAGLNLDDFPLLRD